MTNLNLNGVNEQVKDALLKGHIQPDEQDHFSRLDRAYGPSIYTVPWKISSGLLGFRGSLRF